MSYLSSRCSRCGCAQTAQAPSKDLSQREVAAAQRLSEHALFLQRRQRAFLGRLSTAAERLHSLSSTLSDFSASADAPPAVPPQARINSFFLFFL